MAAEMRIWVAAEFLTAGRPPGVWGSIVNPHSVKSIAGTRRFTRRYDILPTKSVNLWSQDTDPLFETLAAKLISPGVLRHAFLVDTPVSSSNPNASGNNRRWIPQPTLISHCPAFIGSINYILNTTINTHLGQHSDESPLLWQQSTNVAAKVYRWRFWNPSPTDTMTVEFGESN